MAFKRRRRKYTWLPVESREVGSEPYFNIAGVETFGIEVGPTPAMVTWAINPVDVPAEQGAWAGGNADGLRLGDVLGSEYVLKRIVGKFHAGLSQTTPVVGDSAPAALVAAGFFVARAAGEDMSAPIGHTGDNLETFDNYSALAVDTTREPWIWRRNWILGNPLSGSETGPYAAFQGFPPTTAHYGSVLDGPHIDAKTGRRIGQDDRLWFQVTVVGYPFDPDYNELTFLNFTLDYRLLGALRRARQTSRF